MTQRTCRAPKADWSDFPIAHEIHYYLPRNALLRLMTIIRALLTAPPGDRKRPGVNCLTLLKAAVARLGFLYIVAIKVHDEAYRQTWIPNIPSCPEGFAQSLRHASEIPLTCARKRGHDCAMSTQLCLLPLLPFSSHLVHSGRSTSDTWAARS